MKILYVNWAPLWRGAEVGGGVNLYSQSMAVKLAELGDTLFSISSGFAYDLKSRAYIKRGPDFMGVSNYEIFNAPNIAPGFFNYSNPLQDVSEPVVEELFDQFISIIKPHIVHFHNIEGFSVRCIEIAVRRGCRVVFSLHNYHPVCNQIYLLYRDREICVDFDRGRKCLDCIAPPSYSSEIMKRRSAYHVCRLPAGERIWRRGLKVAEMNISKRVLSYVRKAATACNQENGPVDRATLYLERREQLIEGLNRSHMVHAVSEFVKSYYISKGIKPGLVTTCHIGNRMAEIGLARSLSEKNLAERNLAEKSLSKKDPSFFQSENGETSKPVKENRKPLKIAFLGISSHPKGLPFFLETLLSMASARKDVLKNISLHIHARGSWQLFALTDKLEPLLSDIEIHDGYDFNRLPEILDGIDFGVVPPLWYDNAPQVVFEIMAMKIPVIGADIGGIPDFISNMRNGILFRPGDGEDLASKIEMVVKNRSLKEQFMEEISPMKTPDQHARELQAYYEGI